MTFAEYIEKSQEFACYPKARGLEYTALGLANETFELLEKYWNHEHPSDILAELGDVLWYTSACYKELGLEIQEPSTSIPGWTYYPGRGGGQEYFEALGITVGKYVGHVKKWLRLDPGVEARTNAMTLELSYILLCIHRLSIVYGSDFQAVMTSNYAKLADRAQRGVLQGNGDHR